MDIVKTLCSLIAFGMLINEACAIHCFSCNSFVKGCGRDADTDILMSDGLVESGCASCEKNVRNQLFGHLITRSCHDKVEDYCSIDNFGKGTCYCTTSYCNGASSSSVAGLRLVLVAYALKYALM